MTRKIFCAIAIVLSGCSSAAYFARVSAGHVGCPQSAIRISDESTLLNGSQSWTVDCRGRRYYCSSTGSSQPTSCAEDR